MLRGTSHCTIGFETADETCDDLSCCKTYKIGTTLHTMSRMSGLYMTDILSTFVLEEPYPGGTPYKAEEIEIIKQLNTGK